LVAVGAILLVMAGCLSSVANPGGCDKSINYVVGDTARDSLTSGDCRASDGTYYDFFGIQTATQVNLRISLSSPTNQALLWLYDSRGAIIANSIIGAGADTSAKLRVILGPGAYAISVRGVNSGKTGAYRMVATVDTTPVAGCGYVWVTPGTSTSQNLANTDCTTGPGGANYIYHVYTIVLLANQSITFTEHSTAFSPQMTLMTPTGSTVSTADSTGKNASIFYVTPAQGAFQLWVGSSNQLQVGAYTLTMQ
jgi:hypothetical protein